MKRRQISVGPQMNTARPLYAVEVIDFHCKAILFGYETCGMERWTSNGQRR